MVTALAGNDSLTPRKAPTRKRLLVAGRALLLERGLGRVSIDAISERAGYTRGAFYSNFASLDDLLFALYDEHVNALVRSLEQAGDEFSRTAPPTVEEVVRRTMKTLPFDVEWLGIRVAFSAQAKRDDTFAARFTSTERALRATLEPHLLRLVAESGRRITTTGSAFTQALIAAHDGALADSFTAEDPNQLRVVLCSAVVQSLTTTVRVGSAGNIPSA